MFDLEYVFHRMTSLGKKEELQASQAFYSMSFLTVYTANDAAG